MKKTIKVIAILSIMVMVLALAACGEDSNSGGSTFDGTDAQSESDSSDVDAEDSSSVEVFPPFFGDDFEGNQIDESIFAENSVTVVNCWFNSCPACVGEMGELELLNEELKEKGGEVIGLNIEIPYSQELLPEAKEILQANGATYRNIWLQPQTDGGKYINKFTAFPTTIVVDRNGNIIGDPIVGGIDYPQIKAELMKRIDEALASE